MSKFSIITAIGENDNGIGYYDNNNLNDYDGNGKLFNLPWKCKDDMKFFKNITTTNLTDKIPVHHNVVIMGKNTYFSLPDIMGLENRTNIIVSTTYDSWHIKPPSYIIVVSSFEKALELCCNEYYNSKVYVIGGNKLYEEAIKHPNMESIIVSIIPEKYYKDNVTPNIYFPITFEDMENNLHKYLLYSKNDINVYRFKV